MDIFNVEVVGDLRPVRVADTVWHSVGPTPRQERAYDRKTHRAVARSVRGEQRGRGSWGPVGGTGQALRAVDLFSGIGGLSMGAERAGVQVVWASNHMLEACVYHELNLPDAEHICQNLLTVPDRTVSSRQSEGRFDRPGWGWDQLPHHDIMLAAPSCKDFCKAGAGQDRSSDLRFTPYVVLDAARTARPRFIVIENVPEFMTDKRNQKEFGDLTRGLEGLGYSLAFNILNTADFGLAINRNRLFIVASLHTGPIHVESPGKTPKPFKDVIQWDMGNWGSLSRKQNGSPWSERTQDKINDGLRRHRAGERGFERGFVVPYFGNTKQPRSARKARSLDRPLGSIRTKSAYRICDVERWRSRMVMVDPELLEVMGFALDTVMPPQVALGNVLIGNAVSPTVACGVVKEIMKAA
jgi:DNA (cytosine-5)-methyltransferase 1